MTLKRKKAKRRPNGTGCQMRNGSRVCRQDAYIEVDGKRCCVKHAADRLFQRQVRESGPCIAEGYRFPCGGIMEAAHIIGRARFAIRWDERNCKPLCSGHHVWFTHNPSAWQAFIESLGIDFNALRLRGDTDPPMNPIFVVERLKPPSTHTEESGG